MNVQSFWILLFILLIAFPVIYSVRAGMEIWRYLRLDQHTTLQEAQWSVLSKNDEAFTPRAHYRFSIQGKNYQGETLLNATYRNEWTAQEAIQRITAKPIPVWFDSAYPEISSIQKNFPLKTTVYTAILWAVAIYFFVLYHTQKT